MFFLLFGSIGCSDSDFENRFRKADLAGTWKFVGFMDNQGAIMGEVAPQNCDKCYVLTFDKKNGFTGYSSSNDLQGTYVVTSDNKLRQGSFSFVDFGGTKLGETGDGWKYVDNLRMVERFILSEDGLQLFYTDEECLFFTFVK